MIAKIGWILSHAFAINVVFGYIYLMGVAGGASHFVIDSYHRCVLCHDSVLQSQLGDLLLEIWIWFKIVGLD